MYLHRLLESQAKEAKNIYEIYERIFRGKMPKLAATDLDRE